MVKVNLGGCSSFVKDAEYQNYVEKALKAFDELQGEQGAGNDFLGWKTLPIDIDEQMICSFEAIRDSWKAKGVNLVIVIGIGGSYLGARCAIEALSHQFIRPEGVPQVVFAGNNLSEEYLAELMDLAQVSNTAVIVISKSGTTTEPAVAFRIFKDDLNKVMRVRMTPHSSVGQHSHETDSEIILVLKGNGKVIFDGQELPIHEGQVHYCPKGHSHTIINDTEEELHLCCVVPQQ